MWWICLLPAHNCKTLIPSAIPELPTAVLTDASLFGGGRLWTTDWMQANWALDYPYCLHIIQKETFTTVLAAHRWAPFQSGHRVIIKTDSQVDAAILNKESTCCPVIMDWIRSLFWLIKEYCNFSFSSSISQEQPTSYLDQMTSNLTCPPCLLLSLDPRDQRQLDREATNFWRRAYVPTTRSTYVIQMLSYVSFEYTTVTSLSQEQH